MSWVTNGSSTIVSSHTMVSGNSTPSYASKYSIMRWWAFHSTQITTKLSAKLPNALRFCENTSPTLVSLLSSEAISDNGSTSRVSAIATTASANVISRSKPRSVRTGPF
jgi:hypothetical protein